ncbi:MAG: type I methionyl aminopeptidase [Vampirovibrionales bacterium]|nr:type I methionyl aminopeptidase [Vampirovibrionales bacterium]
MPLAVVDRKSRHEISLMRRAGQIVAEVHALTREALKPGVSTLDLDVIAEAHIRKSGALPTFKGYHGFPATLCTSINDEVVHGIPNAERRLQEGDVISIDVGATYKGMIADAAYTAGVGAISADCQRLLAATEESLMAAIEQMRDGRCLEDVSGAVEDVCLKYGFGLVRNYGGHAVGRQLHEEPFVHNFRTGERGPLLRPGSILAIEPMFNLGGDDVYTAGDKWTVLTCDHLPSAHFEHTVVVTEADPEILTRLRPSPA